MLKAMRLVLAGCSAAAILHFGGCDGASDDANGPENTSGVHVVETDDSTGLSADETGIQMDTAQSGAIMGRDSAESNAGQSSQESIPDGMQRITFRGLRMFVPAAWQREAPASTMRDLQMRVPSTTLDAPDAGFVVYGGISGTVQQNIDRWNQQFTSEDGSEVRPLVEDLWVGDLQIAIVELSGTYTSTMTPGESGMDMTMIQAIVETPAGEQIFIRLLGPRPVVDSRKAEFRMALEGIAPAR